VHPPDTHVKPLGHVVQASPFEPQGSVAAMGTTHLVPRQQPLGQLAKLQDPEPLGPPELLEPLDPPELLEPLDPPELLGPLDPPELLEPPEPPELLKPPEPPEPPEPLELLEPLKLLAPLEPPRDPEVMSSRSDDREQPKPEAAPRAARPRVTTRAIRTSLTMAEHVERRHSQALWEANQARVAHIPA
jgi:hypothetical protein